MTTVETNAPAVNGHAATTNGNGATTKPALPAIDPSIILQPNDLPAVPSLVGRISSLGVGLSSSDDSTRLALLDAARGLVRALEKPRETMIRHCWGDNSAFAVASTGVDAGVWAYMAKDGKPKSVAEIAAATNMEEDLLARLLKHFAAMGYITETGRDEYRPSNFSTSLAVPIMGAGYSIFSRGLGACTNALPEFLEKNGYKTPVGNLQYALKTELNMFEWLQAHPPGGVNFNYHMGGYSYGRPSWMDTGFYPVQERLINGFDTEDPANNAGDGKGAAMLVDIGGSVGHDLEELYKKFPHIKGRLVLQDLSGVIGQIEQLDSRIERMIYDFHTPQPVTGARAYYMHSVLHDWPDEVSLSILGNIKAAMKPHSRLLINENVIPDTGAQWEATALDVLMASLLSSKERTRADWMNLLEKKAGFKVNKIYTFRNGVESVIECVLPETDGEALANGVQFLNV